MREIIFRGYDGMDWIYGSAVMYYNEQDAWYMIENGAPDDDWMMVGNVGQYTGLTDCEGRKIYEGDVVRYYRRNLEMALGITKGGEDYGYEVREIIFRDQGFNVPLGLIKGLKVIGDIYEKG